MLWDWWIGLCMSQGTFIGCSLNDLDICKVPLGEVCCIRIMGIWKLKLFLVLVMQGAKEMGSLLSAIAPTYIGGNLVHGEAKTKMRYHALVFEADYRVMAYCMWDAVVEGLDAVSWTSGRWLMTVFFDNQATSYITSNPVFHERIKHIELDFHFVCNAVTWNLVHTPLEQLHDLFTVAISPNFFLYLFNMDIYLCSSWREMLKVKHQCVSYLGIWVLVIDPYPFSFIIII